MERDQGSGMQRMRRMRRMRERNAEWRPARTPGTTLIIMQETTVAPRTGSLLDGGSRRLPLLFQSARPPR